MSRPWQVWGAFGVCLVVVLLALGWISRIALRLEHSEQQIRRQAELEERVRLALWRMDSALAPLIAEESGRLYLDYRAFYEPERAYTDGFTVFGAGEVLVPSALLGARPRHVLVHFQLGPDGRFTSPQVPEDNWLRHAVGVYTTPEQIRVSRARLLELEQLIDVGSIRQKLPDPDVRHESWVRRDLGSGGSAGAATLAWLQQPQQQAQMQQSRSIAERRARGRQQSANSIDNLDNRFPIVAEAVEGLLRPIWAGDTLILARRVVVGGDEYIQGCWLDWSGIEASLRSECADLLPNLALELDDQVSPESEARQLAALPVHLIPGELSVNLNGGTSPIRISLLIAWTCVLLAATAVAVLLTGIVSLSERRAAFVSAVTHEMRTPLTTFRMYTDMLLKDMIPSEEKRRRYLSTLRTEAHRLGHLVENVLSYARLERSRDRQPTETLSLSALTKRIEPQLRLRTEQAEMELRVDIDESAKEQRVQVDASAVEQIVFNLVDNACKYAVTGSERLIQLLITVHDDRASIAVRDHGPGVSKQDSHRLFRPFCKSAHDAANSAPGVGLGLALSRRLARSMGGNLKLDVPCPVGANFVLILPIC